MINCYGWQLSCKNQVVCPVVTWPDDRVRGLGAKLNCEAPGSELLCFQADDPKCYCLCLLTSSLWQRNRELWQGTSLNHHRWLPGTSESIPFIQSHPLPCKRAQWQLVPLALQTSETHKAPLPPTLHDLGSAGPFDAPFPSVLLPKDKVVFAPECCSGSCPDSRISTWVFPFGLFSRLLFSLPQMFSMKIFRVLILCAETWWHRDA